MNIGKLIQETRISAGLSQPELAQACGWGEDKQARISHYETGRNTPGIDDLITIAGALGVSLSDLFKGFEEGSGSQDDRRRALFASKASQLSPKRQKLLLRFLEELQD